VFVSIIFQPEIRMPGQYKRQEGARKYGYSSEAMSCAVLDVNENHMSVKKAAFLHDVNRTTLMNHLKDSHCGAVGRTTLFTPDEERLIVHAVQKLGDWGFGIDPSQKPARAKTREASKKTKVRPSKKVRGRESYDKETNSGTDSTSYPSDYYCARCRERYGDPDDPKASDDWLDCWKCHGSFHESCGEEFGILDNDDVFTCLSCCD